MRRLIRKLIELGFKDEIIVAITSAFETEKQEQEMLNWLSEAKNPTEEELLSMTLLIAEPS